MNEKTWIGLNRFPRALKLVLHGPPPTWRTEKPQKGNVEVMSVESNLLDPLRSGEPQRQQQTLRGRHAPRQADVPPAQQVHEQLSVEGSDAQHRCSTGIGDRKTAQDTCITDNNLANEDNNHSSST